MNVLLFGESGRIGRRIATELLDRDHTVTGISRSGTDEDGESYVSMEDFAIAFVDELETDDAVHTQLGVGY